MAVARALPDLTRTEDFLTWVWEQDYKFEMIEGRLVMMAGGTRRHATIAGNAFTALRLALSGRACMPFNSDFLVQVGRANRCHPDVSVACGETRDFTDKPVLIIEVLSPTTRREDLGPKLRNYRRVPGLRYVLYLWQDEVRARLWRPAEAPDAEPVDVTDRDATIDLPALELRLLMAELYRDVDLPAA